MQPKKITWIGKPELIKPSGMYRVPYEHRTPEGLQFSKQICSDYHQAHYFYMSHVENGVAI